MVETHPAEIALVVGGFAALLGAVAASTVVHKQNLTIDRLKQQLRVGEYAGSGPSCPGCREAAESDTALFVDDDDEPKCWDCYIKARAAGY